MYKKKKKNKRKCIDKIKLHVLCVPQVNSQLSSYTTSSFATEQTKNYTPISICVPWTKQPFTYNGRRHFKLIVDPSSRTPNSYSVDPGF